MEEFNNRWEQSPRRRPRRAEPRLEERLDQWVSAGRQLVDGVAGTRPGSRPGAGLRFDQVGRWVENKIDWLLEDDDSWRESWEQPAESPRRRPLAAPEPLSRATAAPSSPSRQPLQAISRRGQASGQPPVRSAVQSVPQGGGAQSGAAQDWPEDDAFTVNRWRRDVSQPRTAPVDQAASQPLGRVVPRSSRRRFD